MMRKDKRAQAAMEFLMTYGWAILVVLVVIGALSYFGVLNPSQLLPEKCTLPIGFNCKDFRVTNSSINMYIENGAGRGVNITNIQYEADALSGDSCSGPVTGGDIQNGKMKNFTTSNCTYTETGRSKNRYTITLTYTWIDSSESHTMVGELLARLES